MRFSVVHAIVLGAAVRIAGLLLLPDQNLPDARAYVTAGRDLFDSGIMQVHRYMPLYPIWTYIAGGGLTLKLADISLSLATIWIIYRLAQVIFRHERAALFSAFVAALYPHFIFYSVSGLTETLHLFLISAAFLSLYSQRWVTGGALIVLSILTRPALDMLAPVLILVFALIVHRQSWSSAAFRVLQYALVYLVLMAPWWAHQYVKYDQFIRLSLGDGIVWLAGNHPENTTGGGVGRSREEETADRPTDITAATVERFVLITNEVEQNEAMKQAAFQYIRDNPSHFLKMAGIKFVRFWRLWPYAPEYERPIIIAVSLMSYGVVLSLTVWFLVAYATPHLRLISPMLIVAAFLTIVHMATISSIRYRFPIEGFLIIFGSYVLARLSAAWPRIDELLRRRLV